MKFKDILISGKERPQEKVIANQMSSALYVLIKEDLSGFWFRSENNYIPNFALYIITAHTISHNSELIMIGMSFVTIEVGLSPIFF